MRSSDSAERCFLWPLLVVLLTLLSMSCKTSQDEDGGVVSPENPNIVLVTFDTLNIWHTSLYDRTLDTTPNLAELAHDSFFVRRAHTRVPLTLPSHVSMLSGRIAADLGVFDNGDKLAPSTPTLATLLKERGYDTAAFVSLGVLNPVFGLGEGFDHFQESYRGRPGEWYATADEVMADVRSYVAQRTSKSPFFLWVHLSDPHEPYGTRDLPSDVKVEIRANDGAWREVGDFRLALREPHTVDLEVPPGRFDIRFTSLRTPGAEDPEHTSLMISTLAVSSTPPIDASNVPSQGEVALLGSPLEFTLENTSTEAASAELSFKGYFRRPPEPYLIEHYNNEVRFADAAFGELVELLEPWRQETLWAVASDHGEGLYRHGIIGHAAHAGEDQLRILFLLKAPWIGGQIVEDIRATTADLTPTILDLAALPAQPGMTGQALFSCRAIGTCRQEDEWLAYGVGKSGELNAIALYRWPDKLTHTFKRRRRYGDLDQDPRENRNRIRLEAPRSNDPALASMTKALTEASEVLGKQLQEAAAAREIDQDTRNALRALGYLDG